MKNKKVITLYFHDTAPSSWPVYSKPELVEVFCISGNTGEFNDEEWYDTDEGFNSLDMFDNLVNFPILKFAKKHSAFYDVSPLGENRGEWFFTSKKGAMKTFELIKEKCILAGYEILD